MLTSIFVYLENTFMLTYIRITSLYDEYPGKHHFYREVGFTGHLLENMHCGYSLEPPR